MILITTARALAAAISLLSATAAAYTGLTTRNFINTATLAQGTITATHDQTAEITVRPPNSPAFQITQPNLPNAVQGNKIPILVNTSNGHIAARPQDDHTLWAPMWTWIEAAFAALLAAIYGQQLLADPLSVIGFKSWRPRKPE